MEGRGKLTGTLGTKNQIQKVVAGQRSTGWLLIFSLPEKSALGLENREKVLHSYPTLSLS